MNNEKDILEFLQVISVIWVPVWWFAKLAFQVKACIKKQKELQVKLNKLESLLQLKVLNNVLEKIRGKRL